MLLCFLILFLITVITLCGTPCGYRCVGAQASINNVMNVLHEFINRYQPFTYCLYLRKGCICTHANRKLPKLKRTDGGTDDRRTVDIHMCCFHLWEFWIVLYRRWFHVVYNIVPYDTKAYGNGRLLSCSWVICNILTAHVLCQYKPNLF